MKRLFLLTVACLPFALRAQLASTQNVSGIKDFAYGSGGRRIEINTDIAVQGASPWVEDGYCYVNVSVRGGQQFNRVKAKINLETNEFIYRDSADVELAATVPIALVELVDCSKPDFKNRVFITGIPAIGKQNESTFYEVLSAGTTLLLKHVNVTHVDKQNNFAGAAIIRTYYAGNEYYMYVPGNDPVKLDKDNDKILRLLSDQEKKMSAYIAENHLKARNESDLKKIFNYYNSLK